MISLPLWGRVGWGLLALSAIAGREPAASLADRSATTVGDRRRVLWEKPAQLRHLDATLVDPVHHLRPDSGWHQTRPARYRTAGGLGHEQLLQGDGLVVESGELGDTQDLAPAIGQTPDVHKKVERATELLPDGTDRKVEAGHQHHGLHAGERIPRAVGVDRAHRAVVPGVHRLQHVQRLA